MSAAAERVARANVNKFAQRRQMLAESALKAIAEQGYAETGLRAIAQHSDLSHGSLHYYFEDKDDLIALAVWNYKSECARRYDDIVATATTAEEFADRFASTMAATLHDEATNHRLWYDLRNQAMFSAGFRDTIIAIDELLEEMVWVVVSRFAALEGTEPALTRSLAYALFDGVFQNTLIRFLRGDAEAVERLRGEVHGLLKSSLA